MCIVALHGIFLRQATLLNFRIRMSSYQRPTVLCYMIGKIARLLLDRIPVRRDMDGVTAAGRWAVITNFRNGQ